MGKIYQFDGIVLDAAAMRLSRGGEELALEPKSFRLLQFLVENRERVVGKDEILRVVWEETAVTDNALTRAVAQIRKVLEDDPRAPKYIDTVPTVGYRFIGVVSEGATMAVVTVPRRSWGMVWAVVGGVVAVLVGAIGFTAWRMRPKAAAVAMFTPVPLTTYRGSECSPSFSPDGEQVVFDWDGEKRENFDIYVKALGPDASPVRLTNDPAPDLFPAWSPDGRTIAFERMAGPAVMDLMLMPALGGPERKLGEFRLWVKAYGVKATWSANSKWLVVPGLVEGKGEAMALYRVSVETGEAERITDPGSVLSDMVPAISPDGKTLLFDRHAPYERPVLYTMQIDENAKPMAEPQVMNTGGEAVWAVVWTPDSREFVAETLTGVTRLPAEGSDSPQAVPWLGADVSCMDISRHGDRFAYSVQSGDANIWRIDLEAKAVHPEPLIASTARDVYPQYSMDGKRLAFYSNRSGVRGQLWVADAEGGKPRQLTFVPPKMQAASARWSPDGKMLVFDSDKTGSPEVFTMSAEGGRMNQLTEGPGVNFGASWSRDGRWIYYTSKRSGQGEIWKMPAEGGASVQVTHNGGQFGVESEDGKMLYFGRTTGAGSVWRMPVGGGAEEKLTDSLYRANFAVAKRGVYYMTAMGEDGTSALKLYSFATGATTTIMPMGNPEYGLDVSPDGRYLVYAQLDDPASHLMLVENFH